MTIKDIHAAWKQLQRPIYARMPSEQHGLSYADFIATDWLTAYWDKILVDCWDKLDDLPRQFDPDVCDAEYLDFLAPLCGWTDPYWSKDYPVSAKRLLLKYSYYLIWTEKGSQGVLSFVLDALGIEHRILTPGSFILGQSQVSVGQLGSNGWEFEILLPSRYVFNGFEFRLTDRIAKLFAPVWCYYRIRYGYGVFG